MRDRSAGRPWPLRRRIGISAAAVGGILVVLVAAVTTATIMLVRQGNDVIYSWVPAAAATDRLNTDLVEQQSSLRGYAMSAGQQFVTEYRAATDAFAADLGRARQLIDGDTQLSAGLDAVGAAADAWRREFAAPAIAAIAAGGSAQRLLDGPPAIAQFERTRMLLNRVSDTVQDRTNTARQDRHRYAIIVAVAAGLTVLVLVAIAGAIWRGLHRWVLEPVDRLARQTRQVARGDTYRQIEAAGPPEFAELGRDVEAMRLQIAGQLARAEEIHEQLRQRTTELTRSNDDLQQFAYVASHDLSEPLRKVANFCQLLERQYGDQLDDRAKQYIDFAVDGAKRMQALISDLLALSRVGRTTEEFVPVALDAVLDRAVDNLSAVIEASGARIERATSLPTVNGDPALLTSLLENLVSNAVKYRREDVAPIITVSAEQEEDEQRWVLTVSDNGIGIDPQYAERIFAIFQRLHLRDSYGGTGIGLALCRKIVEFHGGHIWLDTVESESGATFKFALPEGGSVAESRD